MKRTITVILILALVVSLVACGNSNNDQVIDNPPEQSKMSKEEMLTIAEEVDTADIFTETNNNQVKAESLYCGKVLKLSGEVVKIERDHIVILCDGYNFSVLIDVYLSTEEIAMVNNSQIIAVVGNVSKLEEREETWSTGNLTSFYYVMDVAYLQ